MDFHGEHDRCAGSGTNSDGRSRNDSDASTNDSARSADDQGERLSLPV